MRSIRTFTVLAMLAAADALHGRINRNQAPATPSAWFSQNTDKQMQSHAEMRNKLLAARAGRAQQAHDRADEADAGAAWTPMAAWAWEACAGWDRRPASAPMDMEHAPADDGKSAWR